jgi:hypothetical protein
MTVKIKEYVRLASMPKSGMFRVVINRNMHDGVKSQVLKPEFTNKVDAMNYQRGVRDGINLARSDNA